MSQVWKMIKLLTITVSLIAATAAFPNLFSPRVINGEIVPKIEEAPYQVSIQLYNEFICGGIIIHEYYVLTAAACITSTDANSYTIRAGALAHNYGGSVHRVIRIIKHEHFYTNEHNIPVNDIALLQVRNQFIFDGTRDAIPLLYKQSPRVGSAAKIFGWGWVNSTFPVQLRKGTAEIFDTNDCSRLHYQGTLPKGQLCALSRAKVPCQKDAGGPLVVGIHLVGVISWGKGCQPDGSPSVYTDVAYYRDWISYYTGHLN